MLMVRSPPAEHAMSPTKAMHGAGSSCTPLTDFRTLRSGIRYTLFPPAEVVAPTSWPRRSMFIVVNGSLSTFTSFSRVPSRQKRPMKLGSRGPVLAPSTSTGSPRGSCVTKRTQRMESPFPPLAYLTGGLSSPVVTSQSRQESLRSQEATTLPSGLKSTSRTSWVLVHSLWRVGASRTLAKRQILTMPSVPPVATMSPEGEALATLISAFLPSLSTSHSHTSFSSLASSESSSTLQQLRAPASHRAEATEKARWTTTLLSVLSTVVVVILPASSKRCTCTWLGTSLDAVDPPPPPVRKICCPLLAIPRSGTALGGSYHFVPSFPA
mmetsp:Transcript_18484/g.41833  ORF Transcript_18484/g.41833 Transcript_18484/m.41833 type:complete len:325 (-) Transcript_18484:79-1053(-)